MASFDTHFSLLAIALLSFSFLSESHRPFILPIRKDPITNLFYTSVGIGTPRQNFNLVIDLGGSSLWYDCNKDYNSSTYHPIPCDSKRCPQDTGCFFCDGFFKQGCTIDEACGAGIDNPLADGGGFFGKTGEDVLFISHSMVSGLLSGCATSDSEGPFGNPGLLKGLPKSSKGILGLAKTKRALVTQLSLSHKLPLKFAICLSSSSKKGLGNLFIGGAPHHNANVSSNFLLATPLIVNPFSNAPVFSELEGPDGYFLDMKSIKVDGQVLNFNSSLLSIDNRGKGGTKLSTMNSLTVLHNSIYEPLVKNFVKKAADRKIKKVASVAPFDACFGFSTIGRTITGLDVPTIDLELEGRVQWTIYGANSMVLVNKKVACLGFVNGGKEPRTSIVIGGHILEDNLLEFDLESSKLSFSSSLLLRNARCSNFRN